MPYTENVAGLASDYGPVASFLPFLCSAQVLLFALTMAQGCLGKGLAGLKPACWWELVNPREPFEVGGRGSARGQMGGSGGAGTAFHGVR